MPDKDINIHVRGQDTEQTKRDIDSVAKSTEQLGQKTTEANKQAAGSTEKATNKFFDMGRILDNIKNQVTGFVLAWLSFSGALKILDIFNQKLQLMLDRSKEFYEKTLQIQRVGQSLEFQTNTAGQQRQWGMKALDIQKAGGFADIATAQQLMNAVDTTYKSQGGLKNPQVYSFLKDISPVIGAAGLDQQEIESLFKISQRANTPLTANAYKSLIAKIQAGAAGANMTFDEFITDTGTGTGFVDYLALGGSVDEAIALYTTAAKVSANKRTGNTLLDTIVQISSGRNKKAERAIERFSGKQFKDMTEDEKAEAVLNFINSLPESQRVQILQQLGFPSPEDLAKLGAPGEQQVFESTRKKIKATDVNDINAMTRAYKKSAPFKNQASKIDIEKQKAAMSPEEEEWQRRLDEAQGKFDILAKKGEDRFFIRDELEPTIIAYEQMAEETEQIMKSAPKGSERYKKAQKLHDEIVTTKQIYTGPLEQYTPGTRRILYQKGVRISRQLDELQEPNEPKLNEPKPNESKSNEPNVVNINHNYDNSINFYPTVGEIEPSRVDPNAR